MKATVARTSAQPIMARRLNEGRAATMATAALYDRRCAQHCELHVPTLMSPSPTHML
jgi:hypothetical protein